MNKLSPTYKGLLIGALMIVVSVILYYGLKLPPNGMSLFVMLGIYILGILWSLFTIQPKEDTELKFKTYFSQGFRTFIVITLLMVVYTAVFHKMNPQILEGAIKETEAKIAAEGNKTPAEIKANSDTLRSIFMPMTISIITVMYLGLGALASVIGGLILSNRQKN